jgi:hypothetical protein
MAQATPSFIGTLARRRKVFRLCGLRRRWALQLVEISRRAA